MRWLRWALSFPAAIVGWYGGVLIGLSIHLLGEWSCPTRYVVSGACAAPWSALVTELAIALGSGAAACLIVLLPSLIAPARKSATGFAALVGGACLAVHFVIATGAWLAFACALLAGSLTVWFLVRRYGRIVQLGPA